MAQRPIYISETSGSVLVRTEKVDFDWFAGFAVAQKQKSIASLHSAAKGITGVDKILEVSSKSTVGVGVALSAFNLTFNVPAFAHPISVECAFQGSKVFEKGGPYLDILDMTSLDAKRDERLRTSGQLVGFQFMNIDWKLEPQTAFYDWIYLNALKRRPDLVDKIIEYSAFTDIEFNPSKSINCQAHSVAMFLSLHKRGILNEATLSRETFLQYLKTIPIKKSSTKNSDQAMLF